MLNSSLIKILRSFRQDEILMFGDFIKSPYNNRKSGAVLLYEFILKYSPDFIDPDLYRKTVWKELFPGKEFNYGVMKNLIYDLTRLSERFIVSERLVRDEFLFNNELLAAFLERDIKDLFRSKFASIEKNSLKDSIQGDIIREDYYYSMWKIYKTKWSFENRLIHSKDYDSIIFKSTGYFMASFLIHSFIIYHNIEAQFIEHNYNKNRSSAEVFLNSAHRSGLISEVISCINAESPDTAAVLNVYYKMFISVNEKNSAKKYFEFRQSLESSTNLFSKRDFLALHITLLNCLTFLESDNVSKQSESLDIYDSMIENNLFFADDSVWDQDFLSYITSACYLGRHKSIEKFISKVLNKLQKDTRTNLLLFANAHLSFARGEFGKSLEFISRTNYDLFQMKYYLKNLQIRNFYELGNFESFELAMDSYIHFLDRNKKVSERWKSAMKNFCSNMNRLSRLKYDFDEYEFKKFRDEINMRNKEKNLWIVRKIEELGKLNLK